MKSKKLQAVRLDFRLGAGMPGIGDFEANELAGGRVYEALQAIAEPSILTGCRVIGLGDEEALRPQEAMAFKSAIPKVRRQSGAARVVARALLSRLGHADVTIPKASSGEPVWPEGIVGSLAHEERVAVAAVAPTSAYIALGIDIEPADELPGDLAEVIATPTERSLYGQAFVRGRQLFAAKEAVYKAVYPLDRRFLDFHDIEVDFNRHIARIGGDRTVSVKVATGSHVVAIAFLRSDHGRKLL